MIPSPNPKGAAKLLPFLFYALLAYSLLLVVPSSFQPTLPYLDSAWGYDLNYFLHSRFRFGPDLIFTYGPLAFLNNPQHVGHDIGIAVSVHALFWVALGAQMVSVWRSGKRMAAIVFCIGLALGHRLYYDYWDYDILALSLITFAKLFRISPTYLDLCLVPVLLGIGFLLKFTAFSMMVLMLIAYTAHLVFERSLSKFRAAWLVMCFASGPAAYLIYDASTLHLAQYVKGALQIATGFTTAMSTDSDARDWKLFGVVCLLLALNLVVGLWQRRLLWSESVLVILMTWSVFRHGFVRGDSAHAALFFGFSILIFATLFTGWNAPVFRLPELILLISFVALNLVALSGLAVRYPVLVASNWWPRETFNDLKLLTRPAELNYMLDHAADDLFAALPGMAFRNAIEGKRVMVFPNGTPYVAKIKFEMFPIYALQDYSAYTAYLDNRGARNLSQAKPPVSKVLIEWAGIDGRNLLLDTPAMSMALLSNFSLESRVPEALLLNHRQTALPIQLNVIDHQPFKPDEWVQVPVRDELVAMSIKLKQNLVGTAVTALYDQDPVYMDLATRSGAILHFRVPPQTLRTAGLINYVPNSLDDLEKLWKPEPLHERIMRIRLSGPGLRWAISNGYYFYQVENAGVKFSN